MSPGRVENLKRSCRSAFTGRFRRFLLALLPGRLLTGLADVATYPLALYYRTRLYPRLEVRRGTSDRTVFRKIFITREYDLDYGIEPRLIIDGGANVGYASVFFAEKFPRAEIYAVEPAESNFRVLSRNVAGYPAVRPLKKGLGPAGGFLKIIDSGEGEYAYMTAPAAGPESGDVEVVTIGEILEMSGRDEIDILKLDIEGAERELFASGCDSWLGKVRILIIELHDERREGCAAALYSAVNRYRFREERAGENLVFRRR